MNNLIKALFLALPLALGGCADEYDTTVSTAGYPIVGTVNNGCIVVSDEASGEREVCSQYYMVDGGYVYWDATYGMWISPYGYYRGGVWNRGWYPGYREYYGRVGVWRGRGWYAGHGYFTGHGGYAPHGYRGNGWHGGYHGGGVYHGGGHFGPRGGAHFGGHGGGR